MVELEPGKLSGACCYLSGPMEFVADHGIEWRRKFLKLVVAAGLDIDCIDPTDKPGGEEMRVGEDKATQAELQRQGRWLELRNYVAAYRRLDLRFVDLSDFLVAVIDPNVHMCGTYDELFLAERQHKPMFFVCEGGLHTLPRWLFDVIDLDDPARQTRCNVFSTIEEVVNELKLIDVGHYPMDQEWVLVRKHIEREREKVRSLRAAS